jgi:hypothetical protein
MTCFAQTLFVALCGLVLLESSDLMASEPDAERDSIQVVIVGHLRHDVVAIGGETTGTEMIADDHTFELDLHGNQAILAKAKQLSGQRARATGRLEIRSGVERGTRYIVHVATLEAAS